MVVVPASFLSQEWINMVSMKPSQRHFNAVATGKRIHDTLADPNEDIVQKRSNFLNELGDFNDFNRKHFGKPPAFRLKAKVNPNSKDYQNIDLSNLVGRQQLNVHASEATNQSPSRQVSTHQTRRSPVPSTTSHPPQAPPPPPLLPPPPTYSSVMKPTRPFASPEHLATAASKLKPLPRPDTPPEPSGTDAFLAELGRAVKGRNLKPTPKRPKKEYAPAHPIAKLFTEAGYATPEAISKRTRSKAKQQTGKGYKRKRTPFQYVSFNKHKHCRNVHTQ